MEVIQRRLTWQNTGFYFTLYNRTDLQNQENSPWSDFPYGRIIPLIFASPSSLHCIFFQGFPPTVFFKSHSLIPLSSLYMIVNSFIHSPLSSFPFHVLSAVPQNKHAYAYPCSPKFLVTYPKLSWSIPPAFPPIQTPAFSIHTSCDSTNLTPISYSALQIAASCFFSCYF